MHEHLSPSDPVSELLDRAADPVNDAVSGAVSELLERAADNLEAMARGLRDEGERLKEVERG